MVLYQFSLKIEGVPKECTYSLDLNSNQEDNPQTIFTAETKENLRKSLQKESLCSIKDKHLNRIVSNWIEDIKEGYRQSKLTLNLPLLIESNVGQLQESGYQHIPMMFSPEISEIEPTGGMLPPLETIFNQ